MAEKSLDSSSLAQRIDEFELEMICVWAMIDILYQLPKDHEYYIKTLEDLHTHKHKMQDMYNDVRVEMIAPSIAGMV